MAWTNTIVTLDAHSKKLLAKAARFREIIEQPNHGTAEEWNAWQMIEEAGQRCYSAARWLEADNRKRAGRIAK